MFVMAGLSRAVVDAAAAEGVDLTDLLGAHAIDRELLGRADAWVPVELHEALWAEGARRTGRDDFGLWAAERHPPGLTGVVEYILRSCTNVLDAAETWCRLAKLVSPCLDSELSATARDFRLVWRLSRPPSAGTVQWAEFALARTVRLLREAVADPRLAPRLVELRHARPPAFAARAERVFGCEVRFSSPEHATIWPASIGSIPLQGVDPRMRAALETHAAQLAGPEPPLAEVAARAARAILASTPGHLTLEEIARRCGHSPRALQRRLGQEGTSVRAIVDRVRREELERLRGKGTQTQLAERLGFADAAALRKALRRWGDPQRGTNFRNTRPDREPT